MFWRIDNGALEGIFPKLVTLMIGTNNLHEDKKALASPRQTGGYFYRASEPSIERSEETPAEYSNRDLLDFTRRKAGPAYERVKAVNALLLQLRLKENDCCEV